MQAIDVRKQRIVTRRARKYRRHTGNRSHAFGDVAYGDHRPRHIQRDRVIDGGYRGLRERT